MFDIKRIILSLCLFLLLIPVVEARVSDIDGPQISLVGQARFSSGDNTDWADPGFDDGSWQQVNLPDMWSDHGVSPFEHIGWYRIRFKAPADIHFEQPAFAGYIFTEYELFLNGEKIDSSPFFHKNGVDSKSSIPEGRYTLARFPSEILNREGDNLLAIRISRAMLIEDAGIPDDPLAIVEYQAGAAAQSATNRFHGLVDGALITMNAIIAMIAIVAIIFGFRARATISFAILSLTFLLTDIMDSYFMVEKGFFASPSHEIIMALIVVTGVAANIEFVSSALSIRKGWLGKAMQIAPYLGVILFFLCQNIESDLRFWGRLASVLLVMFGYPGSMIWIAGAAILAIIRGKLIGWFFVTIYLVSACIPAIWWALNPQSLYGAVFYLGEYPWNVMKQIYIAGLTGVVGAQLLQLEKRRAVANERALRAQSDERQRVSRDMHDSVGQWLGSIKLRLQAMGSEVASRKPVSKERFAEMVGDMDILIDDTKRIARDLSPSSVEHRGLVGAIDDHLGQLSEDYGVTIETEIEALVELPGGHSDHIYRIIQEASNNAVIHGEAKKISVLVGMKPDNCLQLQIRDDGVGFDTDKKKNRHSLGLTSIKERVAMMEGEMHIGSSVGEGTSIDIQLQR